MADIPGMPYFVAIFKIIKYPNRALEKEQQGVTFLSFYVDENGNAVEPEVMGDTEYGFGREVLKAFEKVQDRWIPAVKKGEILRTRFIMPFVFSFSETVYTLNLADNLPEASLLDGVNVTLFTKALTKVN